MYCKYKNQSNAQPICLYIDGESRQSYITYDANISGYTPEVYHGRELQIELPSEAYSDDEIGVFLSENTDLIEEILDSYEGYHDGHNFVGSWSQEKVEQLEGICEDFDSAWAAWDAGDWLYDCREETKEKIRSEGRISVEVDLESQAEEDNVILYDLDEILDKYEEEIAQEDIEKAEEAEEAEEAEDDDET